ncbi:MAG: glycosyltransferase family 1 protein [Ignavibacteriae bacterium]|nr:glycosyltransferase family 1 protein [Ignavibacteriota bacterium]
MRIAYFNANLRKGQDGVTRVMYKMFEGALARKAETLAFTSTLPEPDDAIVPMVKVPSVPLFLQKNYRLALPSYHLFARKLTDFRPDVIHINSPCTLGFRAVKYAQHFDVPIVATYHTHFPTYPRYYKLNGLEQLTWKITRHLYNQVDRTFVPTQPILEELREHDVQNLEYLPNGVDLSAFNPTFRSNEWRAKVNAQNGKPVILFVSRLVWEKDLRVLAEAYRILREKRNDFSLVIVGDGPARAEFEPMMPGAHFLGYKSGKQLAECYASSDIFVFPSTTETFGLVTVEAMASGIVPVAAKIGGAAGIIEEGQSGLFSKPFDAADMARQVEHLLDSPELRKTLAAQALRRAQDFGWDHILEKLFIHYERIIDESRYKRKSKAA